MSAKSIDILIPSLCGGGAEFVAVEWAKELSLRGWTVRLITTHEAGEPQTDLDVPVIRIEAKGTLGRVIAVRRLVKKSPPAYLLAMMPHWNLLAVIATRFWKLRPTVAISGRNIALGLRSVRGSKYRVELGLARVLYRFADGFIAISHAVAAEAAALYKLSPDSVWVVPNPALAKVAVNTHARHPSNRSVTITVPCRLVRQKSPEAAILAAARIRDLYGTSVKVDFFGDGPLRERLEELGREVNVPTYIHGWVDRWFEHCAPDAVVVLPSVAEGFGNVLIEAAGVGIPSVTSSRALGVSDAVVPGSTGVVVLEPTPDLLAEGVRRANDITTPMPEAWLEEFSVKRSVTTLVSALRGTERCRK